MHDQGVDWLLRSRAELVEAWQSELDSLNIEWPTEYCLRHFDCLTQTLEGAGDVARNPDPAGEWGDAGTNEWIAGICALRQVIFERVRADGTASSYAALDMVLPVLDQWLLELGIAGWQKERAALQLRNQELQEQLTRQSQTMQAALTRLEKLERTKSDFISIAAHELKTPLTLVRGYGAILAEDIQGKNRQELITLASGIVQGTERLGQIIDDMIDVASLDADTLDWRRETVYLDKLVDMAVSEVKSTATERDVAIHVHAPATQPIIEGDSQRLYQVFLRVIGNGVKYTPDAGRIDISFRQLRTAAPEGDDEFTELTIVDTGIGIDPDEQEWIFEKFYRIGDPALHSTSKARFKGAGPGLGLTIARGIVLAHGGLMWVESPGYDEVNCPGSEFHIVLPARFGRKLSGRPGRPALRQGIDTIAR
jgi:signal transduction histidine kinase